MSRRRRKLVCQELVEKVDAYLDGELSTADRQAVEEHLGACDHCTGYVEQVRRILQLTADLEPAPLAPGALAELQQRWRARR